MSVNPDELVRGAAPIEGVGQAIGCTTCAAPVPLRPVATKVEPDRVTVAAVCPEGHAELITLTIRADGIYLGTAPNAQFVPAPGEIKH